MRGVVFQIASEVAMAFFQGISIPYQTKISAHLLDEIVGIHKAMPYDVLVFCHGIIIFHVSIKMKLKLVIQFLHLQDKGVFAQVE